MLLRPATSQDSAPLRALYQSAFPENEWEQVANLAIDLLTKSCAPETLSLVAETDTTLVGHVAFSPVTAADIPMWTGALLAPLAVDPSHQKSGIGSALVEHGIRYHRSCGTDILLVYGDPAYYRRFGFTTDAATPFIPPHPLKFPFGWQGLTLPDGLSAQGPVPIRCAPPLDDPTLW